MSGPTLLAEFDPPTHSVPLAQRVLGLLVDASEVAALSEGQSPDPIAVELYRVRDDGAVSLLTKLDPEEFVNGDGLSLIQSRYGGGKYKVCPRVKGGKYLTQRVVYIEPAPGAHAAPAAAAAQLGGDRLDRLERMMERLLEAKAAPAAALPDAFYSAVTEVSKIAGRSDEKLLTLLLENALSNRGGGGSSAKEMLDLFTRGLELGKTINGGGDGFGATVREMLPPALDALRDLARGEKPTALPPGPGAPAHVTTRTQTDAPPAAPAAPAAALPAWAHVMADHVPNLIRLASFHADVDHWAGVVVENIDGERLTFIEDQLTRGEQFHEEFFQTFPEAMGHRSWIARFFEAMAAELNEIRAEQQQED